MVSSKEIVAQKKIYIVTIAEILSSCKKNRSLHQPGGFDWVVGGSSNINIKSGGMKSETKKTRKLRQGRMSRTRAEWKLIPYRSDGAKTLFRCRSCFRTNWKVQLADWCIKAHSPSDMRGTNAFCRIRVVFFILFAAVFLFIFICNFVHAKSSTMHGIYANMSFSSE